MVPRVVALLLLGAGCGRIGFDPQERVTGDGSTDGPGDASIVDAAPCVSFGPWSPPVAVGVVNGTDDDLGPAVSRDGNTIYFQSFRPGGPGNGDLYVATRLSPTDAFGAPRLITQLNSTSGDRDITIVRNGARVYFNSNRSGTDRIYYADQACGVFSAPVVVPELDGGYGPWVSNDELEAVLTVGGGLQLYTRPNATAMWVDAGPLTTVNSPQNDGWPTVGANGRELMFETDRTGTAEIFGATRMPGQAFGAASSVGALNTAGGQADPDLSEDGRTVYFSSDRTGNNDIYMSTRSCN